MNAYPIVTLPFLKLEGAVSTDSEALSYIWIIRGRVDEWGNLSYPDEYAATLFVANGFILATVPVELPCGIDCVSIPIDAYVEARTATGRKGVLYAAIPDTDHVILIARKRNEEGKFVKFTNHRGNKQIETEDTTYPQCTAKMPDLLSVLSHRKRLGMWVSNVIDAELLVDLAKAMADTGSGKVKLSFNLADFSEPYPDSTEKRYGPIEVEALGGRGYGLLMPMHYCWSDKDDPHVWVEKEVDNE